MVCMIISNHVILIVRQEEHGHYVLLAVFDCIDDTVLVKKVIRSVSVHVKCTT